MSRKALFRYIAGCFLLGLLLALYGIVNEMLGKGFWGLRPAGEYYDSYFCILRDGDEGLFPAYSGRSCDIRVITVLPYLIYFPFLVGVALSLPGFIVYIALRLWSRYRKGSANRAADSVRLETTISPRDCALTRGSKSRKVLLRYTAACFFLGLLLTLFFIVNMVLGKGFYGSFPAGEYYDTDFCILRDGDEGLFPAYPGRSCDIDIVFTLFVLTYFPVLVGVPLSLLGFIFYSASRFASKLKSRYSGRSHNRDSQQ